MNLFRRLVGVGGTSEATGEPLRIGARQFYIKDRLGEGGFAIVYRVVDPSTSELFAVKITYIQSKEQESGFRREVSIHAEIQHPNILPLLGFALQPSKRRAGTREGLMLFPLCKSGTLQDAIDSFQRDNSEIPATLLLTWFSDICSGIEAFHSHVPPLAFRDLKPANIIINSQGRGSLIDLGSVAVARLSIKDRKEAMELQEQASEHCTAPYRAPELFLVPSPGEIDERTDIWSLGCVLYAMTYSVPAFDGSATAAIGGKIRYPENFGRDCLATVNNLIEFMLVTDAKLRPNIYQVIEKTRSKSW